MRFGRMLEAFLVGMAEAKLARAIDTDDVLLVRARSRAEDRDRQATLATEERTLKLAA
ncbi:MAG TPA: hypothetical protein VFW12_08015 [Candidatus Limnocylindria bacterium]|nr:hypothetical protein [Candidatus Limnocylindria bacterium]